MSPEDFTRRVLHWYERHGRRDLPWQHPRTPYRVWVSEIMLQQTQVATVVPYFRAFVRRFAGIKALAGAELDEVLHLWTGLGYYARARNLHRAARHIRDEHGGRFPRRIEAVMALPGIGRSTAGAILAQACGQRHAILDGNVKRVLSRFHAVAGWAGQREIEQRLWQHAEAATPGARCADYTQAIMDLGATVCRPRAPECGACPVRAGCAAHAAGAVEAYPQPRPRKRLPVRQTTMLILADPQQRVLLTRRPPAGLWGGLWGFPECASDEDPEQVCRERLGLTVREEDRWPVLRHSFSHFHLDILPVRAAVLDTGPGAVMEDAGRVWYNTRRPDARGLSAPVARLLAQLRRDTARWGDPAAAAG